MQYAKILIAIVVTIAVAGILFAAFGGIGSKDVPEPAARTVDLDAVREELQEAEAESARLQAALASAEMRNRQLEEEVIEAKQSAEATNTPAPDQEPEKAAEEKKKSPRDLSLDEIRETLRSNPAATAQITALTELVYADFLNSLDVDPEVKAELRRLLTESLLESMALSRYAIGEGNIAWSEVRGWELEERAYLDAQLRELLPDEAYASWTEYFQDFDSRQLEGNLHNQIATFASGLSPENFDLVMQVAVEEFRAQQSALEQSTQPFTLQENVQYQLRAIDAMRTRLTGYLAEDQLVEIENWFTMAERLLGAQISQNP